MQNWKNEKLQANTIAKSSVKQLTLIHLGTLQIDCLFICGREGGGMIVVMQFSKQMKSRLLGFFVNFNFFFQTINL